MAAWNTRESAQGAKGITRATFDLSAVAEDKFDGANEYICSSTKIAWAQGAARTCDTGKIFTITDGGSGPF